MDEIIINFFQNLGWWGEFALMTIELICATLLSGLIGYEREVNGHHAGLRTHILVSIGACLIMILSISAPGLNVEATRDPARLAAQVVSGIGFLGAGTIIQNGTDIKGLTTAATLWLCGGIGLACGSGYFSGAIVATIVSIITLTLLSKMEIKINRRSPRVILLVEQKDDVLKDVMDIAKSYSVEIRDIHSTAITSKDGKQCLRLIIKLSPSSREYSNMFSDELKYRLNPIEFKVYNR